MAGRPTSFYDYDLRCQLLSPLVPILWIAIGSPAFYHVCYCTIVPSLSCRCGSIGVWRSRGVQWLNY